MMNTLGRTVDLERTSRLFGGATVAPCEWKDGKASLWRLIIDGNTLFFEKVIAVVRKDANDGYVHGVLVGGREVTVSLETAVASDVIESI